MAATTSPVGKHSITWDAEANEGGWNALFVIVVVFVLVIAGIIFYNNRRHRSLTRSMRDREDVQRGVAKLTERGIPAASRCTQMRLMSSHLTSPPRFIWYSKRISSEPGGMRSMIVCLS